MIVSEARLRKVPTAFRAMNGLQSRSSMPWRRTSCRQSPQRCQRSKIGGAVGSGDARRVAGIRSRCRSASNCCWWSSGCGVPDITGARISVGISHPTVLRTIARCCRSSSSRAGHDAAPGHGQRGRRSRRDLPDLLAAIPELTVIVDTFDGSSSATARTSCESQTPRASSKAHSSPACASPFRTCSQATLPASWRRSIRPGLPDRTAPACGSLRTVRCTSPQPIRAPSRDERRIDRPTASGTSTRPRVCCSAPDRPIRSRASSAPSGCR